MVLVPEAIVFSHEHFANTQSFKGLTQVSPFFHFLHKDLPSPPKTTILVMNIHKQDSFSGRMLHVRR